MAKPITSFSGKNFFLSNFYQSQLVFNGEAYPSAEHAYQAQKCISHSGRDLIRKARTPGEAKRMGRHVVLPMDWELNKVDIMKNVLRAKFARERFFRLNHLYTWLLATGDAELIEGNTWGDTYWGQCPVGNGQNMLGKLLMQVREELRG